MLGLSAVAVDKDIVGKDSDAELIGGEEALGGEFPLGCTVSFDFGEPENSWDRRLDLTVGVLIEKPPFPEGEKDGGLVEESLEELLLNRRGIAGNNGRFQRRSLTLSESEGALLWACPERRGKDYRGR